MRKLLPTLTTILLPVVAATTFLACGSSGDDEQSAGANVTTATTEAAGTTEAPSTTAAPDDAPDAPDTPAEGASCDNDTLLTATRAALQVDIEIVSVTVEECQNGYARLYAHPDESGCGEGGSCYENEQVFLSDTDGQWTFLDAGTGIACSDADLSATTVAACEALGLR